MTEPTDWGGDTPARGTAAVRAAAVLDYATRFDIPIPGRPGDAIVVRKAAPGRVIGTQWAITDDVEIGQNVWSGGTWIYRGELHREQIYAWNRDDAIREAERAAERVAAEVAALQARLRAHREANP